MSKLFTDTMQGLLEAVAIKNGDLPVARKINRPGVTYRAVSNHDALPYRIQLEKIVSKV